MIRSNTASTETLIILFTFQIKHLNSTLSFSSCAPLCSCVPRCSSYDQPTWPGLGTSSYTWCTSNYSEKLFENIILNIVDDLTHASSPTPELESFSVFQDQCPPLASSSCFVARCRTLDTCTGDSGYSFRSDLHVTSHFRWHHEETLSMLENFLWVRISVSWRLSDVDQG